MADAPDRFEAFRQTISKAKQNEISDLNEGANLIVELIAATEGWVIVDFLDAANWDRLAAVSADTDNGLLELHWHDFRNSEKSDGMAMAFPADLYGCALHFNSLQIVHDPIPALLIRGYALSSKESKKLLAKGAATKQWHELSSNFFSQDVAIERTDGTTEMIDVLSTPIYSAAIIPKRSGFRAIDSKRFLFFYNIQTAIDRAIQLEKQIAETDDQETINEKGNSLRRTLEFMLKIEVCYRDLPAKKGYGNLLLGDLVKLVKPTMSENEKQMMNLLVRSTNSLSHDSGKPVNKDEARVACLMVAMYGRILALEVCVI